MLKFGRWPQKRALSLSLQQPVELAAGPSQCGTADYLLPVINVKMARGIVEDYHLTETPRACHTALLCLQAVVLSEETKGMGASLVLSSGGL